jgi:AcrR family transcriptional regulator
VNTRKKILQAAQELYNAHGVYSLHGEKKVTLREIAKAAGIADGNLRYHFPKQPDLLHALYMELVEKLETGIGQMHLGPFDLSYLYQSMVHTCECLYEYKFLMLDFVGIMRRVEKIKTHFVALTAFRQQQFKIVTEQLIANGSLKPPSFPGQMEAFYQYFQIAGDFWISSAEIFYQGPEEEKVIYYVDLLFQGIVPYLTEKGLKEYQNIIGDK